jgi:hypothetical protein
LKSAFSTALQFAYNTKRLNEIASQPLSSFTSLKAFNSIVKITALSERADAIDSSYSNYKASKINGDCGKIFISESEFKILNESAMYLFTKYVGK